ncbi:succinate dehydrogenase assembly factor 2, mitochondrial-like [Panonychus citri]|uniref:succinate dehydrogenase assembly factor 2, mitochondrial-like n=1 Tax=Panonychus citri TaxID=50023 RepID=UPI0023070A09|nr:succinate dehydrogenase assembly factor 2, mitochondrial-like [Panonychus citri]
MFGLVSRIGNNFNVCRLVQQSSQFSVTRFSTSDNNQKTDNVNGKFDCIDLDNGTEPPIPLYQRFNESIDVKRARLLYQSRKRGMLENDLLLSTFAHRYLDTFDGKQLDIYDSLINSPSNDWDLFYWVVGKKETPSEFSNPIMDLLKEHAKNHHKENRTRQPTLY